MKHGKYAALVRVARDVCIEVNDYYGDDSEMYPHRVLDKMPALRAALLKATPAKKKPTPPR